MGKIAVLAEKPSVGRDIARVLGCVKGGNGYFEGSAYIVTWALGHLVSLADPEAYGAPERAWRLDELPIMPDKLKLKPLKETARQFKTVREQLSRKDVDKIIIATDAGREGELVARWILDYAHIAKPLYRLWISSVTDRAITDGFKNLRPGRQYDALYHSAAARAAADWYVGINATRALTTKFNAQLSCGRVQTPTLAIIAQREREINAFAPKPYYGLQAVGDKIKFTWQQAKTGATHSFDREYVAALAAELSGVKLSVTSVDTTVKQAMSPELYNLTELQRDANKQFGFSAKETLAIMQKLYETHKYLTYPRTDSRHLTSDIVPTLKERLSASGVGPYTKLAFQAAKNLKPSKHFVDDAKVSDHHAIIPTEQFVNLAALSDRERKIYDLVVRRFIAALYPPFVYEETKIQGRVKGELFTAKGQRVNKWGWKEVYQTGDGAADSLPALQTGDTVAVRVEIVEGRTKPPAPFNEASLLAAMENPLPYMAETDKALRKTLTESGGLGTVATRADIIDKLFKSSVVEKRGQDIFTTAKGRQLLELAPRDLRQPELTAKWERQLTLIAAGKLNKDKFIAEIKDYTVAIVKEIKDSQSKFRHDNITRSQCPECGKLLLEVNGKNGKMLVCQDRECNYRKRLTTVTNARCPNCHKKMELRGEGDGKLFFCQCGYKEKLTAFQKRRGEESQSKVSKREVAQFMQKQRSEPVNTALAEALAKLKLNE